MPMEVKGFLAEDGKFFEREPECKRYEFMQKIQDLCDSHGTNFENFMAMLNSWHVDIRGYYDANDECNEKWTGHKAEFDTNNLDDDGDVIPTFLRATGDHPDITIGDKDAPAFLEQQIRRGK
jgi:hypothetical protein